MVVTDNFNRADNLDLGVNWTIVGSGPFSASGMKILSNACLPESDSDKLEIYSGANFGSDQYAQAKCSMTGTTSGAGPAVYVRASTGQDGYRATVSKAGSNNVEISKFVAGAFTSLALRTTTWVDGDVLRIEVRGSTVSVFQNGVQLGSGVVDASLASGFAGIGYSSSASLSQLDDWEAGDLVAIIALFKDNFNRADNASLGVNWTTCTGTNISSSGFQILSNHAEPETPGSDAMEVYTGAGFHNDQYAQAACTVTGTTSGTGPGVFVRGTTVNNPPCYRACVNKNASNNVEVIRQVGTTYTSIGLRTTTWVDGDILRLEVYRSTLRVFQNGVQLGADISDGVLTAGSPGIIYSTTASGSQIDNWEAGDLIVPIPKVSIPSQASRW